MKSKDEHKGRSRKLTDDMIITLLEDHIKIRIKDSEHFRDLGKKFVNNSMRQIAGMLEYTLNEDATMFTLMLLMIKRQKNRLKNYQRKK